MYLNDGRVAMRLYGVQAGWYYFVNDHLGTPQKITDSSAQVVWHGMYEPFGKAGVYPAGITCNFRFPGQYYDAETGLHYNWHRYYDPETGRYITADPIGLEGGINLYVYVTDNPVNLADLWGLFSEPQKQQIITSWRNTGAVVGAFIGSLIGGGGGSLTGPAAVGAIPAGAYAGAAAGGVVGGISAEILAKGVLHISASMQGRWWERTDDFDDDEFQGGREKMCEGDNTAKNKQFEEALRQLYQIPIALL